VRTSTGPSDDGRSLFQGSNREAGGVRVAITHHATAQVRLRAKASAGASFFGHAPRAKVVATAIFCFSDL